MAGEKNQQHAVDQEKESTENTGEASEKKNSKEEEADKISSSLLTNARSHY